jgi:hypothetical protein
MKQSHRLCPTYEHFEVLQKRRPMYAAAKGSRHDMFVHHREKPRDMGRRYLILLHLTLAQLILVRYRNIAPA